VISQYRVYRVNGGGSGQFACIHQSAQPSWVGGDPTAPAVRQLFSYLVTAVNANGDETLPGTGTGGILRSLSGVPCP
jgi:hypothetical protein